MSSYLDLCTKETQHYFAHKGFQFDSAQIVALILKHTKAILWPLCLLVPTSCLLIHTSLWVAEGQLFDWQKSPLVFSLGFCCNTTLLNRHAYSQMIWEDTADGTMQHGTQWTIQALSKHLWSRCVYVVSHGSHVPTVTARKGQPGQTRIVPHTPIICRNMQYYQYHN